MSDFTLFCLYLFVIFTFLQGFYTAFICIIYNLIAKNCSLSAYITDREPLCFSSALFVIFMLFGISKFQAVRIQKKILHSHDDKTFFISPWFCRSVYNHYFLKRIWKITERTKFLRLLFL